MSRRLTIPILALSLAAAPAMADEPFNIAVPAGNLSTIFLQLYGANGLIVDSLAVLPSGDTHSAHFNSAFQSEFTQFNVALASKLSSVPLPSPASGVSYELDPALGVFKRSTVSFGPIFAETASTIGDGRFALGFTFQNFAFDSIEGLDLGSIPAVFSHDGFQLGGGRADVVTTVNSINARVSQSTLFASYGITDRLDVSVAVPVISSEITVVSAATVQRIGTEDTDIHFFRSSDDHVGNHRVFTAFGSATGLGDLTLRVKQTIRKDGFLGLALGLDLRLPTGDEKNLLGSGATGIRPFVVWSDTLGVFSPHANLGYLWNGSSVLAGDPTTGEARDLPDQLLYVIGADIGLASRVTLAFDVIGSYVIDAPRLMPQQFQAQGGSASFPDISFQTESFNELSGALGFKVNLVGDVLLDGNVLFNLNDNGLRDKITPMLGLEYSF